MVRNAGKWHKVAVRVGRQLMGIGGWCRSGADLGDLIVVIDGCSCGCLIVVVVLVTVGVGPKRGGPGECGC